MIDRLAEQRGGQSGIPQHQFLAMADQVAADAQPTALTIVDTSIG
jgi:hypothetical protein